VKRTSSTTKIGFCNLVRVGIATVSKKKTAEDLNIIFIPYCMFAITKDDKNHLQLFTHQKYKCKHWFFEKKSRFGN
jgi:hypothetical protein